MTWPDKWYYKCVAVKKCNYLPTPGHYLETFWKIIPLENPDSTVYTVDDKTIATSKASVNKCLAAVESAQFGLAVGSSKKSKQIVCAAVSFRPGVMALLFLDFK